MTECTMRRRSSSRCSRRLMPGSSARSVTAARARPTRLSLLASAMVDRGLLTFRGFRARSVYGFARGLLFFHCFLVAGIELCNQQILVVGPFGGADRLSCAGRLDRRCHDRLRRGSRFRRGYSWRCLRRELRCFLGLHLGGFELLLALLLFHHAQLFIDLHFEVVAGAAELGQQLADLA